MWVHQRCHLPPMTRDRLACLTVEGKLKEPVAGLCTNNLGQSAHHRKGWKDVRVTQTPTFHSTPLAPGMLIQSTQPAPMHLPYTSTFCFVSMHSNVAFSPEVGHLGYLSHLKAHRDACDETLLKQPHLRGRSWKEPRQCQVQRPAWEDRR